MEILPTNGPAPAGKSFSENIMDFVRFLNADLLGATWRNELAVLNSTPKRM
jgi:hypothetical protein